MICLLLLLLFGSIAAHGNQQNFNNGFNRNASLKIEQQEEQCGAFEKVCDLNYCFDRTCDGLLIRGSNGGKCLCEDGFVRSKTTRRCGRISPNCITQTASLVPKLPIVSTTSEPDKAFGSTETVTFLTKDFPLRSDSDPGLGFLLQVAGNGGSIRESFSQALAQIDSLQYLYSLYHMEKQDHFYATSLAEVENAVRNGYKFEGPIAKMASSQRDLIAPCDDLKPLFRWWKDWSQFDHFYTVDKNQGEIAKRWGYVAEGTTGMCVTSKTCGATLPLHRFYNDSVKDHVYVTKFEDYETLKGTADWTYEGIECYVWPHF